MLLIRELMSEHIFKAQLCVKNNVIDLAMQVSKVSASSGILLLKSILQ